MAFARSLQAALFLTALAYAPAFGTDATNGEQLARRWCASCHVVAADQRQASADAPSFASIGAKPDFDANALAFFLLEPHPKMPNMSLTRNEAADLASYINSLRR